MLKELDKKEEEVFAKYIIIGAGLSGITSAYEFTKIGENDFLILESRNRIGGRVLTKNNIDFGATWFQWNHKNMMNLLKSLNIGVFDQYSRGKSVLVYNTMAPVHYFKRNSGTPNAYRVKGGTSAIIKAMASSFLNLILTNTKVLKITETNNGVSIATNNGVYNAEKVIITIPPLMATHISYVPKLPTKVIKVMKKTHTWMSNAIKIGLTFSSPFWRDKKMSGTIIGQVGPIVEIYDHSDFSNQKFALMGFVNEALRDVSSESRKWMILEYLEKYLGSEVLDYLSYEEKDWSQDQNTNRKNIKSIYMSPVYGNTVFEKFYMNGKLLFSGAETSKDNGGYMEGAIHSGLEAAKKVINYL